MVDFDLDACLSIIPNKYQLILLAKTRAEELALGADPLVKKSKNEKNHLTALKEISMGFHDFESLNEKFLTHLRNKIFGISLNLDEIGDCLDSSFATEFLGSDFFKKNYSLDNNFDLDDKKDFIDCDDQKDEIFEDSEIIEDEVDDDDIADDEDDLDFDFEKQDDEK